MSALALDEFTLEMRLHYIETTLESLERFHSYENYFGEVKAVIEEWITESRSNEMSSFVKLLEILKTAMGAGSLSTDESAANVSKLLSDYLLQLKSEEDGPLLFDKYQQRLQQCLGSSVQLFLQCISQDHHFIVPVKNVIEIVTSKKVFPLPLAQPGIRGLMSFRGQGIPVINLNDFGFKQNDKAKNEKTCFVVCDFKQSFFALEVQSTEDVLELDPSEFQNCSESSILSPVVERFAIKDEKSLMLLDIEKLVSYE